MTKSEQLASRELGIVGGGNIAEALLTGLLRGEEPLFEPGRVMVVEPDAVRADDLRQSFGVRTVDIEQAGTEADILVIAVKPHHVDSVLTVLTGHVTDQQLVISVAGGTTTAQIENGLAAGAVVVRCMPNTATSVGEGMIAISGGIRARAHHLDLAEEILKSVGRVVRVSEAQLDAVTALSGSGPAYFFYLAEAMIDAGVLLGLPRPLATKLVTQTAAGSGVMLRDSGRAPETLRAAVCSPGGTTMAAIRQFEDKGVRSAVMAAAEAARDRSAQLGAWVTRP